MDLEFDYLLEDNPSQNDMPNSDNAIEVSDDVLSGSTGTTVEFDEGDEEDVKDQGDTMSAFLKEYGIEDPSKIKFENEDGEIEDVDFNSLSKDEQLTMLQELTAPDLSEHEIEVINYLRRNGASFNQVIDYFANQRLQQYLDANPDEVHQKEYSIDDYTDDELYLADLKSKFPSFTDDELISKLNIAKYDEDLFQKEVDALRESYKAEEDRMHHEAEIAERQQYEDLQNHILHAANNFNEISLDSADPESDSLIIEDEDKRQMLAYLLNQDADGKSQFVRDIENPNALIELAWFRTHGRDTIEGITRYWKDVLKNERKKIASLEKQLGINKSNKTVVASKGTRTNSPGKGLWDELI